MILFDNKAKIKWKRDNLIEKIKIGWNWKTILIL